MAEPDNPQPENPQPEKNSAPSQEHGAKGQQPDDKKKAMSPRTGLIILIVIVVLAVILGVSGVIPRLRARKTLRRQTDSLSAPDVSVARPTLGQPSTEIVLPGNMIAYKDADIYARTNGYLQAWYHDIGSHVQQGELLAIIDSPEIDQQLQQAKADLATSQATANNAAVQSQRYQNLLKADAVSKQDTDNFTTQAASSNTQVQSSQANVNRLEQLVGFERIYAPFSGTVTARNVDIGTLIDSGASREIFHISDERILRVYVNVPQPYSPAAKPGVHAALTLTEYPGQSFDGVIVRTAKAIDPASRTLLVEADVDNRDGKLYPGSYAQVHLKLGNAQPTLVIPVPTLIFRSQGLQVGTVVNNKAKLVPIVVGQDDGKVIQVTQGLHADDEVIQAPPDSLIDGEPVNVVSPQQEGPPHPPGAGNPMENKPKQAGESKNDQNGGAQKKGKKKKPQVEHGGKVS